MLEMLLSLAVHDQQIALVEHLGTHLSIGGRVAWSVSTSRTSFYPPTPCTSCESAFGWRAAALGCVCNRRLSTQALRACLQTLNRDMREASCSCGAGPAHAGSA